MSIKNNASALDRELGWLSQLIQTRLQLFLKEECAHETIFELQPPKLDAESSNYASFVVNNELTEIERVVLILSLSPHLKPEVLDPFLIKNRIYDKRFSEFGGFQHDENANFIPTGETVFFLLSEGIIEYRLNLHTLFDTDHPFIRNGIIQLQPLGKYQPYLKGLLTISQEYLDYLTTGVLRKPDFSPEFPARRITTSLEWEDLVLKGHTLDQLIEIKDWLEYGTILLDNWGLSGRVKPGYKCLFYGPPGTGKTLAGSLLGKLTNRDVYRIDLSLVVSKYIGETEKNLAKVFDKGENKNWILFFDEADALFGKRGETQNAHDRYANQEVSYLLQRIEEYAGLVILATNFRENIDAAFTRRFQSIIHFAAPGVQERYKLWKEAFSSKSELEDKIDLMKIAKQYDISGALIMNAVQYASIRTLKKKSNVIKLADLEAGIKKELIKDGISIIKN